MNFPRDEYLEICRFYGEPGDESSLASIELPYPMRIAWAPATIINRFCCHRLVAQSLKRCLQGIRDLYPTDAELRESRMDLFGGCFNFRKTRNGNGWSRHTWGIAVDLDPDHNALDDSWPGKATMPESVVKIFEGEGWKSLGRTWGRDAQHFQATQ